MIKEINKTTSLVLKYKDKKSSRFTNIVNDAASQALYSTAAEINKLQTGDKILDEVRRVYSYEIADEL